MHQEHEKVCIFCKQSYVGKSWSKYCSSECHSFAQKLRIKERYQKAKDIVVGTQQCIVCGKDFFITKHIPKNQKHCSCQCANKTVAENKFFEIECIVCHEMFAAQAPNAKTCSDECRKIHNNNRRVRISKKNAVERICRYCGNTYKRERKRNGFCGRSCASKFYIENGIYDEWRLKTQERTGENKKCVICFQEFYAQPYEVDTKILCSKECMNIYMSKLFSGENNPNYGKKEMEESKEKRKKTLLAQYGVENAYLLAKHKMTSKLQLEIYDSLCVDDVLLNKHIRCRNKRYLADIVVGNLIIEFNGDYWHTNPKLYNGDYWHQKKEKFAFQIWEQDRQKINHLLSIGYDVIVIWENDYLANKQETIEWINKEILSEKKENFNDIRSSVGEYLADVKSGELLECPESLLHHSGVGNGKCDGKKRNKIG